MVNDDAASTARFHCIKECVILRRTKSALMADGLLPEFPLLTNRILSTTKFQLLIILMMLSQIYCHPALTSSMLGAEDFEGAGVDDVGDNVGEANIGRY